MMRDSYITNKAVEESEREQNEKIQENLKKFGGFEDEETMMSVFDAFKKAR